MYISLPFRGHCGLIKEDERGSGQCKYLRLVQYPPQFSPALSPPLELGRRKNSAVLLAYITMSPLPGSVIFVNIVTTHSASAEKVTDATKKSEPQIITRVNFTQVPR